MARIFTTCMYLMLLFTAASIGFSVWADSVELYRKDAFNGAMGIGAGWFALGMVFIGRMRAQGNDLFTPFNLNVCAVATAAVSAVGVAVVLHAVPVLGEGAGALVGAAVSTVVGGASGLTMALAKRDDEEPAEFLEPLYPVPTVVREHDPTAS